MFYFDAHCHILSARQLIKASQSGVSYFICNATSPENWEDVYALSEKVSGVYPCIGVHPWFIEDLRPDWQIKMQLMLEKYPHLMIGEIGLDGNRPNLTRQAEVFEICLKMARIYKRPVHIHGYKAWQHIADILACYPQVPCLFHRFTGSEALVRRLLNVSDAYFSIMSGKSVLNIPVDKLLVETDSPDGLRKPIKVIELVEDLNLDKKQLADNFSRFVGSFNPTKGVHPADFMVVETMVLSENK